MALSITKLRREFEIRKWKTIIDQSPYVAVVQLTASRAWGRTNMKHRVLGEQRHLPTVSARFAVPRAAREGARRTRFDQLATLFRSSGSAVVYGTDVDDVVAVVRRAQKILKGGELIGGRFGEVVITRRVWETVLASEGERAEWGHLVAVLAARPPIVDVIAGSSRGLVDAIANGGRAQNLTTVLDTMAEGTGR